MYRKNITRLTRRRALKRMSVAGVALATMPTSSLLYARRVRGRRRRDYNENLGWRVSVFRLKTRETRACHACKVHHRYVVAISRNHINKNRAHPGCNCPIVRQKIMRADFRRIFLDTGAIRRGVVDLRQLEPGE